jgi:Domain of unknown function (DUF4124)
MNKLGSFMALLLITAAAQAGVFKCETAAGLVYSEKPCPKDAKELNFQTVKPTGSGTSETGSSDKLMQQMQSEIRARKNANQAREEAAAKEATQERSIKCAKAKEGLSIYSQPVRVFSEDKNGERTYVDDDARATIIENLKGEIQSNCE